VQGRSDIFTTVKIKAGLGYGTVLTGDLSAFLRNLPPEDEDSRFL
jgi:hypothetical protein